MKNIEYNFYYSGPLLFKTKLKDKHIGLFHEVMRDTKKEKQLIESIPSFKIQVLNKQSVQVTLDPYLNVYKKAYKHWYNRPIRRVSVEECWVNVMKPGDFIPPHVHTECDLSSVLFLDDLPREIEQQGTSGPQPGSLNFIFCTSGGKMNVNESNHIPKKGDFFIFPSDLTHWVFPFKDECKRLSIAANYKINYWKNKPIPRGKRG